MNRVIRKLLEDIAALEQKLKEGTEEEEEESYILGELAAYRIAVEYMILRRDERRAKRLNDNEGEK